ncbi:MAG: hypothetical protein LBF08_07630 [Dysgonamonadaceae bacterium]|jgi:hypothetical protein|nr:hypothetical protein [Dysgonamonadaceae bacterium]
MAAKGSTMTAKDATTIAKGSPITAKDVPTTAKGSTMITKDVSTTSGKVKQTIKITKSLKI